MKILIDVNSGFKRLSIIADKTKNIFTANGKNVNADIDRFIFRVCDTILKWPMLLESDIKNINDGTTVIIFYEYKSSKRKYKFINKLPNDYYKLEILLDEVKNCVEGHL